MNEVDQIRVYETIEATYRRILEGKTYHLDHYLSENEAWIKENPFVHAGIHVSMNNIHTEPFNGLKTTFSINGNSMATDLHENFAAHPGYQAGIKIGNRLNEIK